MDLRDHKVLEENPDPPANLGQVVDQASQDHQDQPEMLDHKDLREA